jgi:hypothetical protein
MTEKEVKKINIIDIDTDKDGDLWFLVCLTFTDGKTRKKWLLNCEFKDFINAWQFEIPVILGK